MEKIPKKLKECHKTNSFIVDDKGIDKLLVYSGSIEFRKELVKRYNDYNLLKVYVIVLSISVFTLTVALWMK